MNEKQQNLMKEWLDIQIVNIDKVSEENHGLVNKRNKVISIIYTLLISTDPQRVLRDDIIQQLMKERTLSSVTAKLWVEEVIFLGTFDYDKDTKLFTFPKELCTSLEELNESELG